MKLNTSEKHVSTVVCQGDLDAESMIRFKNSITRVIQQKRKVMILDLGRARRVNFSGLGIFLDRLQKLRAMNFEVRITNIHPEISKTFDQVGARELIESCQEA